MPNLSCAFMNRNEMTSIKLTFRGRIGVDNEGTQPFLSIAVITSLC